MGIAMKPLQGPLGAEITGIDLSREISPEHLEAMLRAWRDRQVLVFPGQQLSEQEQMRFAGNLGALQEVRTVSDGSGRARFVMYVANREVKGEMGVLPDGEMQFHVDQCYYERPAMATLLHAITVPPAGGNTRFLNACLAYESLPPAMRERIDGLHALHVYDYDANSTVKARRTGQDAPRFVHPVVTVHPDTGRRVLYVNRLMTDHIVGLPPEESAALVAQLVDHAEQPAFIHEHAWRPGDLVLWDNRCVQHARTDFDPSHARVMRRVTVRGGRPVGIGPAPKASSAPPGKG